MVNRLLGIGARETVGQVLQRHRGIGPGFDLLRVLLSLYIFYGHAFWIAGTGPATSDPGSGFNGWTRPFHVAAVPVFFALSGFLVTSSAMRLRTTSTFLAFRALRIFPALLIEVSLCALALGPVLTVDPPDRYFTDPATGRYLGNMLGFITFHLPGLFLANPVSGVVNINLWTLPSEFDCYAITAGLMLTGLVYRRMIFTILFLAVAALCAFLNLTTDFAVTPGIYPAFAVTFCFFTGIFLYHWQDRIPAHWALFLGAGAVAYALLMTERAVFIAPFLLGYCTIFCGLVAVPRLPLIRTGDYSYGIYLYGFPISQALTAALPALFVGHRFRLLACSALVTCSFAVASWHLVEKRVLGWKRHLPAAWFPVPKKRVIAETPEARATQAAVP